MLNIILTMLALASAPTPYAKPDSQVLPPIVVPGPTTAHPKVVQESNVQFRALAVPAGQRPSEENAVEGVDSDAGEVEVKNLDPAFAKAGWTCVITPLRRTGPNAVERSVACTQKVRKVDMTLVASSTGCPLVGEGMNYTTVNLGVGDGKGKLAAGVTLVVICRTEGSEKPAKPETK